MEYIKAFAQVALQLNDIFALIGLLGGIALVVDAFRPLGKVSGYIRWTLIGLFAGMLGQMSIQWAGMSAETVGLFKLPYAVVNILLVLALVLLVVNTAIRQYRPVKTVEQPKPGAKRKRKAK